MKEELKREWYWHVLFWLGYMAIKLGVVEYFRQDFLLVVFAEVVSLPLKMLVLYFLIYLLIPKFLLQRKYFSFGLILMGSVFVIAMLRRLTDVYIIYPVIILYGDEVEFWNLSNALRNLIYIYPVVGLGTAIHLMTHWIRDYHQALKLKKEKLEAELKFLKAQVHPHFLFNTINNIYSLALDKSDQVPGALVKLSDLLSYMIYECNVERIALSKEVEMLESYIELEKLRYSKRLRLDFTVSGQMEGTFVAPLMLLPFVDNAFKHGPGEIVDETTIVIDLTIEKEQVKFFVRNDRREGLREGTLTSGIGLENVERRLKAEYPDKHELNIRELPTRYEVELTMNLI